MKSFRLLSVGLLCLAAMIAATSLAKPTPIVASDKAPGGGCDCTVPKIVITDGTFSDPNLSVSFTYAVSGPCDLKFVLYAQCYYFNGTDIIYGDWVQVDIEPGSPLGGVAPTIDGRYSGWSVKVVAIRVCDMTAVGASPEYNVPSS